MAHSLFSHHLLKKFMQQFLCNHVKNTTSKTNINIIIINNNNKEYASLTKNKTQVL